MKKHFVIFAAAVAALFAACTKETPNEEVAPVGMVKVELTASVEGMTKTTYDADGKFSWTKGDQISVLCSDDNFYTFTAKTSAAKSAFVGEIPEGVTLEAQAFFPADANHAMNTFNVPSVATLKGVGQAALPMVGDQQEDGSYSFMHCTGAYMFTVENIPVDYTSVEVTIATASLKLSGSFGVYLNSDEKWTWNAATTETESEKTYVRTVDVADGKAVVYLPYSTYNLWGNTTIAVAAYDADNKAKTLLPATAVSGLGDVNCARATVYPVKPIVLPDPVPEVDWDAETVASYVLPEFMYTDYPQYCALTELKAFADETNIYARLKSTTTSGAAKIRFCTADTGEGSESVWYWENSTYATAVYKSDKASINEDFVFGLSYNGSAVALETVVDGTDVYWLMTIPRSAHDHTKNAGAVNIGFLTYDAAGAENGFMPKVWGEMLKVTLP